MAQQALQKVLENDRQRIPASLVTRASLAPKQQPRQKVQSFMSSKSITVIVQVTFKADVQTVKTFIQDEQIPFIAAQQIATLKRFEWFFNDDETSATLIEFFEDGAGYSELAMKVVGTPINLKFRELVDIKGLTILGEISDALKEKMKPMGVEVQAYMGGFSL